MRDVKQPIVRGRLVLILAVAAQACGSGRSVAQRSEITLRTIETTTTTTQDSRHSCVVHVRFVVLDPAVIHVASQPICAHQGGSHWCSDPHMIPPIVSSEVYESLVARIDVPRPCNELNTSARGFVSACGGRLVLPLAPARCVVFGDHQRLRCTNADRVLVDR